MSSALNSLGFDKPPRATRVVAAMSGGVDSSVVAALLKRDGYDVVGVTLQLYDYGKALKKKGACCAGQDIHDARQVAARLDIPHYVLDYEERFRRAVIDDFAESYAKGQTPIPCVRCNERIKFGDLLALAHELGADALATGHYVRRTVGASGPELHRAADASRDQSYFLFATTAAQLDVVCAFRWAISRNRRCARSRARWTYPSPTSPIPRTSASCRRAVTPTSWSA